MRQDVNETLEVSRLELLHRVSTHNDLEAWAAFQQSLEETVLTWLHEHPGREAACHMHSERYFVAQAFERLQQIVVQKQVACETLSKVLMYLRASLNGAILETLRVCSRPGAVCEHVSAEQDLQGNLQSLEIWSRVQARLSSEYERRLAYLLYHCGLGTCGDCAVLPTGMERCPRGRSFAAHHLRATYERTRALRHKRSSIKTGASAPATPF